MLDIPKVHFFIQQNSNMISLLFPTQAERRALLKPEVRLSSRPGLHAFQAVQSRSALERDVPCHSALRPRPSLSPKGIGHSSKYKDSFFDYTKSNVVLNELWSWAITLTP